jgi:hypothetical protein
MTVSMQFDECESDAQAAAWHKWNFGKTACMQAFPSGPRGGEHPHISLGGTSPPTFGATQLP